MSQRVHILLNDRHLQALREISDATGLNNSDIIRVLILHASKHGMKVTTK